jgi:hypothetical protein
LSAFFPEGTRNKFGAIEDQIYEESVLSGNAFAQPAASAFCASGGTFKLNGGAEIWEGEAGVMNA